jgi:acyl carrier protein phosphodiesterase
VLCDIQDGEGEMESICIGGGEIVPEPSTLARIWNSWAKDSPTEKEFDERADDGKSLNDVPVRSEDVVIRLSPKTLGRFRNPGSLSTVAKEMADNRPMLGASEDDIE